MAAVPVAGECYSQPEPPLEWEGFFPPVKPSVFSGPGAGHTVIFLLLFSVTQLERKGSEDSELARLKKGENSLKLLSCVTKKHHLSNCYYKRSLKDLFKLHYFQILSLSLSSG